MRKIIVTINLNSEILDNVDLIIHQDYKWREECFFFFFWQDGWFGTIYKILSLLSSYQQLSATNILIIKLN